MDYTASLSMGLFCTTLTNRIVITLKKPLFGLLDWEYLHVRNISFQKKN